MFKKCVIALALIILLAGISATILGQDARTVVSNAIQALGAGDLKTIQYSATGSAYSVGQNVNPSSPWTLSGRVKAYSRELDFETFASRVQTVRIPAESLVEQTHNQTIAGNAPWATQFDIWITPYGFLKGALANNASLRVETMAGEKYNVVSFLAQSNYRVEAYINSGNMVAKVRTWIDDPVLGDIPVEVTYDDYKDFGGLKFPTTIVQRQGGFPVLILIVNNAKANVQINIQPTQNQTALTGVQPATVQTQKVADGVFYLMGGTHHSVAVEFRDHAVVIEAPQNEQRSLAVIAEVKKQIPNKPITHLVNTHHHFDHSGGLRTYVDEGVTIITHEINKAFYEKVFAAPHTINPDRLAKSGKKANLETMTDKKVLADETRTLELHLVKDSSHNNGLLMAYLPEEKILIEADAFTPLNPPAPNAPTLAALVVNPHTINLATNVEKLKLDFDKILPLQGTGMATRADLYTAIGKPVPDITALQVASTHEVAVKILDTICMSCHNLDRVMNKNLSKQEWEVIVERMKGKGITPKISDDDTGALVNYLVTAYGPK